MNSIMLGYYYRVFSFLFVLSFTPTLQLSAQFGHIEYAMNPVISSGKVSASFDISAQDLSPTDVLFNSNGTVAYIIGNGSNTIYQYNLSQPYDLSTASLDNTLNVGDKDGTPTGMTFSSTGFQMFVAGSSTDSIYQYNLSTPYDISTANIFPGASLFVGNEETSVSSVLISPDGTTVFAIGTTTRTVYAYNLSNANTVATGTYSGVSFDISSITTAPNSMRFNANGTSLFIGANSADRIFEFRMSTPYDIGTALDSFVSLDLSDIENTSEGIALDSTGTALFVVGASQREIFRFDLTNNAFVENNDNTGSVSGEMIISITGDAFNNPGGTLVEGSDYTVDNLPSGLVPTITVAPDATSAVLTLSGSAILHDDTDDVEDIQITFTDNAVVSEFVNGLINATAGTSGLRIDFMPDEQREISYAANPILTTAEVDATLDISLVESNIRGLYLSPDGTRIFLTGVTNTNLIQMDLGVPFDVSSASTTAEIDVNFDVPNVSGFTFHPTGTRAYVVGALTDAVHEVLLEQPYDLTDAYFTGKSHSFASEDGNPEAVRWNNDGTKLFMLGSTNDNVYEYTASVPYDIESLSFTGKLFSLNTQTLSAVDLHFNADGSRMYISDTGTDRIYVYQLETPFDLLAVNYTSVSFSVNAIDPNTRAFFLSEDGTRLLVSGVSNDNITSFDLSNAAFVETGANDGSVEGEIILTLAGDQFQNAGATLTEGIDYAIDNLPPGLLSSIIVSSDGLSAYTEISNVAITNNALDGIADLQFSLANSAFVSENASSVANAVSGSSGLRIEFNENLATSVALSPEILITTADPESTFDVSTVAATPTALTFSETGDKMYVAGITSDDIFEYSLSQPYDISTATLTHQIDIAFEEGNISSMALNPTGSRLYILGKTSDALHEYLLETPFDLSTAAYLGIVLEVGTEDTSPDGFYLNREGTTLFMIGQTNDAVFQYNLEEPYDFATASFSGVPGSVASETISPVGVRFNVDGTRMFTMGNNTDRIFTYDLSFPFDISTAAFTGITFSLADFETTPEDF
ncbi:MAG: hypothetical protein WBA74_21160, partial [Cyclobacteriaceae bacterium]